MIIYFQGPNTKRFIYSKKQYLKKNLAYILANMVF
jgi:hypothetical protein